ncbi:hypothetical protein KIPB_012410, partial [Kipferlia bialata]
LRNSFDSCALYLRDRQSEADAFRQQIALFQAGLSELVTPTPAEEGETEAQREEREAADASHRALACSILSVIVPSRQSLDETPSAFHSSFVKYQTVSCLLSLAHQARCGLGEEDSASKTNACVSALQDVNVCLILLEQLDGVVTVPIEFIQGMAGHLSQLVSLMAVQQDETSLSLVMGAATHLFRLLNEAWPRGSVDPLISLSSHTMTVVYTHVYGHIRHERQAMQQGR